MACGCGGARRTLQTQRIAPEAEQHDGQEQVVFISPRAGFYTCDSGRRYKSYGLGTKVWINPLDRPSLVNMGLIAPTI